MIIKKYHIDAFADNVFESKARLYAKGEIILDDYN